MQGVTWDSQWQGIDRRRRTLADIVNLKADFSFGGATVTTDFGGGVALGGWAVEVTKPNADGDMEAVADGPTELGEDGTASHSEVVSADDLPVTYTVKVADNQVNTLDGNEKYEGTERTHTHNGLSLPATMEAGTLEVTYLTQTLKVYVYEERDQVMGYTGNVQGGDVRMDDMIDVEIRYIDRANGRSREFPTTPASAKIGKSESNGVITFTNVPANSRVIVRAEAISKADPPGSGQGH